jgi:hypothetical protein
MHTTLLAELDALPARWEAQGTVAAPADAVAELLLAVTAGRVGGDNLLVLAGASAARQGAMTVAADEGTYRVELAGTLEPVEIQIDAATLAVQTWYAGTHTLTACPEGTRVTHRVQRVLPDHPGFAAGIAELGLQTRIERDLHQLLAVVADRLGC